MPRWVSPHSYSAVSPYVKFLHPSRSSLTHSATCTSRIDSVASYETASRPWSQKFKCEDPNSIPPTMTSGKLSSGELLIYLRDSALTDQTVDEFRTQLCHSGPLGFDIEYRPTFTKGPLNKTALVQLASPHVVFLVQVSAMSGFPETIKKILEDSTIVKAGVGIRGDADKLFDDYGVKLASYLELSYLARAIDPQWKDARCLIGLARLAKAYDCFDLKKNKRVTMSDWEQPLTELQKEYAANDACAGLALLQKLYAILEDVRPAPATSLYLF